MSLLQVSGLAFRHPSQSDWLFKDVSFEIAPGDRIGLVGPNGSGKTSLLRILGERLEPSAGTIVRRTGLRTTQVNQEVQAPDGQQLLDFVLHADGALAALRDELRQPNRAWKTTPVRSGMRTESPTTRRPEGTRSNWRSSVFWTVSGSIRARAPNSPAPWSRRRIYCSWTNLAQFPGAIIVVSHDEQFVSMVAKDVLRVGESVRSSSLAGR